MLTCCMTMILSEKVHDVHAWTFRSCIQATCICLFVFSEQAYRSYLLAYSSHSLKNIYDVHELDLQAVAKAFGFAVPPRVSARTVA